MSGTADVQWTVGDGEFTATITISGDVPGAQRAWHVHFGSCPNSGSIIGPPDGYPPLEVGADGVATATATVAFELDASVAYSVNVHESPEDLPMIIACGDLINTSTSMGGGGGGTGNGGGSY